ncbi:MAG TPA: hypothetical protein VM692_01970 [Gammaproteobacteria bacterium]|nr:hypothetical protein [Gammaproteobacteria bacterium]
MKTLRTFTIGCLLAAAAGVGTAAEEPSILTITVAAKHAHAPTIERVTPDATVEKTPFVMPTDMPEADIHYQLAPIGAAHAPSHE